MPELKSLSKDYIPSALKMAERYRLLNEPFAAESICQDILAIAPDNQDALVTLLLALTDTFKQGLNPAFSDAMEVLARLSDKYCNNYYRGVISRRPWKHTIRP